MWVVLRFAGGNNCAWFWCLSDIRACRRRRVHHIRRLCQIYWMLYRLRCLAVHLPSSLNLQLPFCLHTENCCMWLSAASCFIIAYATGALRGFSAVRAHAGTVVYKVSAIHASRLIFLITHPFRLCHKYFWDSKEFKVSEKRHPAPNAVDPNFDGRGSWGPRRALGSIMRTNPLTSLVSHGAYAYAWPNICL